MQTTIQGLSTHYIHTSGDRGTVLFLHGWGAHIGLYQPVFDLLSQLGYGVAAFDMPGVGGTEEPKAPLTLADYCSFTLDFCREMGLESALLMGHSHGGRVALSLLEDPACPVRFPRAILMDAAGVRLPATAGQKSRQGAYKLLKHLGTGKLTAPLFGDLYEQERDKRSSADYRAATPVMRETMKNILPCDLREHMPDITAQVLLIWGENDTATPLSHGRIMEERIPGAGLAVIRGAGHFCFADNWPQFSAVMRAFL